MKQAALQRKTAGLNQFSDKRKKDNSIRARVVKRLRETRGGCEAQCVLGCTGAMDDPHEILTRGRGGSITDPENIIMCCRRCHDWITNHPNEADCAGFTVPSSYKGPLLFEETVMEEAAVLRTLFMQGVPQCASWCQVLAHQD